jgi:hypothetical protein
MFDRRSSQASSKEYDRRLSGVLNIVITDLIKAVEKEDKEMDNLCICQDQSPPPRTQVIQHQLALQSSKWQSHPQLPEL